jgi:mercuric ion binding protein
MKPLIALVAFFATLTVPAWAATRMVTLSVPGMTCPACPITVKTSLSSVEGVSRVNVHYDEREAVVTFDDDRAAAQKLTNATSRAGYPSNVKR